MHVEDEWRRKAGVAAGNDRGERRLPDGNVLAAYGVVAQPEPAPPVAAVAHHEDGQRLLRVRRMREASATPGLVRLGLERIDQGGRHQSRRSRHAPGATPRLRERSDSDSISI